MPTLALLDKCWLTGYHWSAWKRLTFFFFSWKKNISVMLSWFIWGIKGNLEFKYKWEHEKKSPFSFKCLSIFTFLFLGMNNPQAFMSRVSYFCPDITHSLCLHHFLFLLLFSKEINGNCHCPSWLPFSQELGRDSSLVLKILDFQVFDMFPLCTHWSMSSLISLNCLSALSQSVRTGHSYGVVAPSFSADTNVQFGDG